VARIAKAAGAKCYTDPFVANAKLAEHNKLMERLIGWLDPPRRNSPKLQPARASSYRPQNKTRAAGYVSWIY